jgi:PIG-X / PBN1
MSSSSSSSSGILVLVGYYQPKDVLHFQCYANDATVKDDSGAPSSSSAAADSCCTSIWRAQSHMQQAINIEDQKVTDDYPMFVGKRGILHASFSVVECEQNILYPRHHHHHPTQLLPAHSWFLSSVLPQQGLSSVQFLSLLGMLTRTSNKTAARNLESEDDEHLLDPCSRSTKSNGIVNQNIQLQWCSWRWLLWDDADNDFGHLIIDTTKNAAKASYSNSSSMSNNAAWVPTNRVLATAAAAAHDDEPPIQNGDDSNNKIASFIDLSSTLSKSGGMHREIRQKLTFSLPTTAAAAAISASSLLRSPPEQYDYSIDVLLQLPSGLFINVEDATLTTVPGMKIAVSSIGSSRHGGSSRAWTLSNTEEEDGRNSNMAGTNTTSSSTMETTIIIDQEEPAFVSPSHLVLCRLTGPLASASVVHHDESNGSGQRHGGPDSSLPTTIATIELTWDTHLHVRYPWPMQNSHRGDSYTQITFMPPMIVAGEIFDRKTNHSYTLVPFATTSADADAAAHDGAPFWMMPPARQAPHTLWVATGYQDDFGPVFVLTLLAALMGTFVLLRDMMLIFQQDDASSSSSSSLPSSSRTRTVSKTKDE